MARSGLDWIIIDMEHGPIDLTAADAMIAATSGRPLVPLVRVPGGAPWRTIEHIDAVDTVADVVSTQGLDLVFIGPGDLATSMGLKGKADHPAVLEAIGKLESTIKPSSVMLGGVANTTDQANAMIGRGYRALVVGFDWSLLQRGISSAISGISKNG